MTSAPKLVKEANEEERLAAPRFEPATSRLQEEIKPHHRHRAQLKIIQVRWIRLGEQDETIIQWNLKSSNSAADRRVGPLTLNAHAHLLLSLQIRKRPKDLGAALSWFLILFGRSLDQLE